MTTLDHRLFRRAALALALALALGGVVPTPAHAADDAAAEEDDSLSRNGKTIKLRKFDSDQNALNEEYARLAEQKRMESIERLKGLLQKGVADETKAEMMLRLADLYFEQGRYLYLKEMAVYDQQYEACFNQPGCEPDLLQANNTGSRAWQEKSIKLYQGILTNYPRYNRADQATFFLGSAYKDIGDEQNAVESFKTLVKVYPDSDYIPDAYVNIGEYYFEVEGNAYGALKAYQKASTYTNHPKYSYAMYKLAWCEYNVGEYQAAIDTMKKVVDYSMSQQQSTSSIQLQDEALKDLVRFFADADQMDEAITYFTQLGRTDLIRTTLKRLAAMFFEQGKFDRSVQMYQRLIIDMPMAKDNPEYQTEIITAYKKMGEREKALEEIYKLRNDYGPGTAWQNANAADPNAVADANDKIESQLRGIAVDYHNTARQYEKTRHPDTMKVYGLARDAYAKYIEIFATNEHAYEVHYAYAELLYKLKDYAGAYEQYMATVDLNPQGEHSKFCAESAIFAAEEQIKAEGGGGVRTDVNTRNLTENVQAQPLTAWEQRFVDACNKYATLYPQDKKVKDVIYKSAYLLYGKYRFEEASKQFQAVIAMDPRSKEAELAANLILDTLNITKNWEALKQTAKTFRDQEGLGSPKFKEDVASIYMNSSFKVIEVAFEKDKDYGKAADGFVAFAEEFPSAAITPQALNNAAAYYTKAGRVADSMKVRHILVDDPRFGTKTKYYYDQIAYLGYDYEQIADYDNAALYYEKLWALTPEEKKKTENADKLPDIEKRAGDAIYSAAVFRKALGATDQAVTDYNAFVAAYPDDERVADTRIRVAKIYEESSRWQDAANAYQAFYKSPPANAPLEFQYFARLHYGQAMEKLGKMKERDAVYKETVNLYEKYKASGGAPGPHTEFVAEMMYQLAAPSLEAYTAMRITGPGRGASRKAEDKALVDSLSKKAKALVEVEKSFTAVVATGAGEWGLASLVALGKAYENMAESMRTGDVPSYLTEDQRELYKMGIEDRAYVQDEKAVNAYKLALEKSYELTLYNENTAHATRRLGELRPDDFPGLSEQLLDPRWTSSKSGTKYSFETSL
ncbi:MAG: tetratricopeptide repeat protein [Alphaproteobacteria bacterium]|nr:tetratricopeptide repeat protein [Alphaproteobacteria bacterium]MCB9696835.1 tetratricopeptide repeat protein [Alphaproteobacteria bacterium]